MIKNEKLKAKVQENITNLKDLGQIPVDEVQLNLDVAYNSILSEICAVVPMESPRQIVSYLKLKYGSPRKAISKNSKNDVIDAAIMNGVGALPLDEYGYMTDEVEFTTDSSPFIGEFKNIIPGTVKIGDNIVDDGNGKLSNGGTVDYEKAIFVCDGIDKEMTIKYKFDIYNIMTSQNTAYFEKASKEVFASIFQLDVHSAVMLNDFVGVNLKDNIDKILPQVLSQQIDNWALSRYFDLLDSGTISNIEYTEADWIETSSMGNGNSLCVEMAKFANRTGVRPNVILCDPMGLAMIASSWSFDPITDEDKIVDYAGMPKKVGYFNDASVFVTKGNILDDSIGKIILTYRGPTDAQASSIYTPFIPVTLRTVLGAEAGGMVTTNNAYSVGGFTFLNTDLIQGIKINM